MKALLTLSFWFKLRGEMSPVTRGALILLIVSLVLTLVYLKYKESEWRKSLKRSANYKLISFTIVNLIFGLYVWFVMEQMIPVLSARIWFVVWALEMLVWGYFIRKEFSKIPKIQAEIDSRRDLKRYIPVKK